MFPRKKQEKPNLCAKKLSNEPDTADKNSFYLITAILLMSLILRILFLGKKCFWADEGITWFMALGEVGDDASLFYSYIFKWSINLFGWNEWAGRLPSAIAGFLTILIVYHIGRRFFNPRMGLYAAIIASLSSFLIPVSQEMRIYSLLGLEILLTMWIFLEILSNEKGHITWWVGLLIVGIIGQYTHCFFIFVLGYFGLVYFIATGKSNWRGWIKYSAMMILIALAYIPQLLIALRVTETRQYMYAADLYHLGMNIYRVMRSYFCFLFGDFLINLPDSPLLFLKTHLFHTLSTVVMISLWFVIVIMGLSEFIKIAKGRDFSGKAARIMLGMMAAFTLMFIIMDVSSSRHLVFVYAPFLFVVSSFWVYKRNVWAKVILIGFLLLNAVSLYDYYRADYFAGERADWRKAAGLLKSQINQDDAVFILRERNVYYTLKFYWQEIEGENMFYRPHRYSDLKTNRKGYEWWMNQTISQQIESLLNEYPRIWIIESFDNLNKSIILNRFKIESWNFGKNLRVYLCSKQ